jgi:splicing factor 1
LVTLSLTAYFPSLEDYVPREYWDPEKKSWETGTGQRSPSPEPAYDRLGRRTNTRDLRMRMRLQKERQSLLEKLCQLQPSLGPAFSFPKEKKTAKLFIPQKEYPNYPFIGLILGPRGNTQKKLEKETGAKIIIRGKGSVKDGKRAKMDNDPSQDEELHVHISADTDESV